MHELIARYASGRRFIAPIVAVLTTGYGVLQPPYKVNLDRPDKTVLVQLLKSSAAVSVVGNYWQLQKFNIRELCMSDEERAAKEAVKEADRQRQQAKAAAKAAASGPASDAAVAAVGQGQAAASGEDPAQAEPASEAPRAAAPVADKAEDPSDHAGDVTADVSFPRELPAGGEAAADDKGSGAKDVSDDV